MSPHAVAEMGAVASIALLCGLMWLAPMMGRYLDERPKRRAAERAAAAADPAPAKLYGWHTTREGAMKCPVCKKGLEKPKPQVPEQPVRQVVKPGAVMNYAQIVSEAHFYAYDPKCRLECCS